MKRIGGNGRLGWVPRTCHGCRKFSGTGAFAVGRQGAPRGRAIETSGARNGRSDQSGRAQGRTAAARAVGHAWRGGREFFFDLSSPFTYLAAERVERAFEDVVWTPASSAALQRGALGRRCRPRSTGCAAPRRSAPRRCGCRCLARAIPGRRARRHARGRARAAEPAAARRLRARRDAARVLRRLRPRGPGDPRRGGGRRRHRARRLPARRARRGRDGGSRRPAGGCSPSAPTGCRRCASGARCTGASTASPTRRSRRARRAAGAGVGGRRGACWAGGTFWSGAACVTGQGSVRGVAPQRRARPPHPRGGRAGASPETRCGQSGQVRVRRDPARICVLNASTVSGSSSSGPSVATAGAGVVLARVLGEQQVEVRERRVAQRDPADLMACSGP